MINEIIEYYGNESNFIPYKIYIIEDNEIPKFSASDQIRQAVYYLNEKNKMSFRENQLIDIIISNKPPDNNDKYLSINLKSL